MKVPIKRFQKGAFVYLSGNKPPKEFYIIKDGKIKLKRTNQLLGKSEETRSIGYIFGVIQCITGIVEDESAFAITDVDVFVISKDKIRDLFINHKKVILKILAEYSEILRKLDADLINYNFFPNITDRKNTIFDIIEKYMNIEEEAKASHLLYHLLEEYPDDNEVKNKSKLLIPDFKKPLILDASDKLIYEITLPANSVVFTEFELANTFFIIKYGKVKITKLREDREILLAILGESDIFGEMAILNDKPRNATACTEEDTSLMVISKSGVDRLPPPIFVKLLEFLSKRIWLVQQQLIAYKLPSIVSKLYYILTSKIRQVIQNPEEAQDSPFLFRFPLKELCNMIDYEYKEYNKSEISDFLNDKNLDFYQDSIKVKKIGQLLDKNAYYISRYLASMNIKQDKIL